jgi:integrase
LPRVFFRERKISVVQWFESHPLHSYVNPTLYEFLLHNLREVTAQTYIKRLKLLAKLGDLDNPERIKTLICTYQVSESRKELLASAYDYYVRYKGLTWIKPRFTREDKPIFVPLENEIDMLISNASFRMSTWLELLKETGADSGEAWKLRWVDINAETRTVSITPTKNHNARTLPIISRLLSRLLQLPRRNERVFASKDLDTWSRCYTQMRSRLANKLNNPRLSMIAFRSFRHFKATMEYHRTKDILHVKWLLGHKRIENTIVYTHSINFGSEEYTCRAAKTVEEATQLISEGFEHVCSMGDIQLFRKRK